MDPLPHFFQRSRIAFLLLASVTTLAFTFRKEIWQSLELVTLAFGTLLILSLAYLIMRRTASTKSRKYHSE